jgi:hypothetical protein
VRVATPQKDKKVVPKTEKKLKDLVSATTAENARAIQHEQSKSKFVAKPMQPTVHLPLRKTITPQPKVSKRQQDLRNLIHLDFCIYDLLDIQPLNEYELYMRSYGTGKVCHQYQQTNEDILEVSIQTEDWEICDRWTQCPPHQLVDAGEANPAIAGKKKKQKQQTQVASFDPIHLAAFLEKSSTVMDRLLLEQELEQSGDVEDDTVAFKNQRELHVPTFIRGTVQRIQKVDATSILVCWTLDVPIKGAKSIICVYHLTSTTPVKYLLCLPTISVVHVSHSNPHLVFAGTLHGSIQLWDLREPDRTFKTWEGVKLRWPTFLTDSLLALGFCHSNAIRGIIENYREGTDQVQISSIDEDGGVQSWVERCNVGHSEKRQRGEV